MGAGPMETDSPTETVTPAAVDRAAGALREYLDPTPLQSSLALSQKAGCRVHLKIESIQPTRSFKVRGALNKLIRMTPERRSAGLITASAGNHGLGVAYAARVFAVPARVHVPEGANRLKVEAIRRLAGQVVERGASYQEAFREAERARARTGATLVHAYDDAEVIAGQGTVAVEILQQLPDVDTVLVPVGGGGLISGIALYLKAHRPSVRVVGVEPSGADAMTRSLGAGHPVSLASVVTAADGLAASATGKLTFEIARRCVDRMIRVEEPEMLQAIRLLFEWEHLLAEPAGAAAAAALLFHYAPEAEERVVVMLSGANVTDRVMVESLASR
ncbi:MAG: threonine/serine dehydratase [Candidatus Dormibacteraeota bacterium]|nr:threonine/serine dehydratase [Candidatus Dormibacteraeota bacterium]